MLKKTTSKSLSVVSQEITINTDETKKADHPHLIEKILANLKILGILSLRALDSSINIFKNNEFFNSRNTKKYTHTPVC